MFFSSLLSVFEIQQLDLLEIEVVLSTLPVLWELVSASARTRGFQDELDEV